MNIALVIKPVVPLYASPLNTSERVDEVLFGMLVTILNYDDENWCLINTEYNYRGYIAKDSISIVNYELYTLENYEKMQIISFFADILEKPAIESSLLITLPKGAFIYSTEEVSHDGKWTKVSYEPNCFGWIKSSNLRKIQKKLSLDEDTLRNNLIKDALTYLGVQYRWGGKTPLGIDCSGLCFMAYWLNNITIFRDAKLHSNFPIKKIEREDLKKADLIYFPGHVAMYLGNNKFIHASNSNDKVQINSLASDDIDYDAVHCSNIINYGSYFK